MKNKKMSDKEFVEKYKGTLEHFIVPDAGGWPIKMSVQEKKELCKHSSCFYVNDDRRLAKESHIPFRDELLVEFWKLKYEEMNEHYEELYERVRKITEEF